MKIFLRLFVLSLCVATMFSCQQNEELISSENLGVEKSQSITEVAVEEEVVTLIYSGESEEGEANATELPKQTYCVYRIISAGGADCPEGWKKGAEVCIDCPESDRCPTPGGGQPAKYEVIGEDGKVICSGEWVREIIFPDTPFCSTCPEGGLKGFEFVN